MQKNKRRPLISIIIPLYKITPQFYEAVDMCLKLQYENFEILIGVDGDLQLPIKDKKIRVVRTQKRLTGPGEKRDLAILKSKGEFIAFLDDDSYPNPEWLNNAIKYTMEKKVSSVCGPGLTPPKNGFWQKVTGAILSSYFGSGPFYYRFAQAAPRFVDDYPAYNMIVSKEVLNKIGGFGTKFYGGEDTALCLKIVNAGYKIYYHPQIIVFHHRRKFPTGYLKQVGNVGLHRGYFVKKYPKTSLRLVYFLPLIISSIFFVLLVGALIDNRFMYTFLFLTAAVYFAIFLESLKKSGIKISPIVPVAVMISHFAYAFNFIKGLNTIKLIR